MHPRNPYKTPPDFSALADAYEALRPYLISGGKSIDFKDAEAQRRLTEAIMYRDFSINLHIPLNRLCPPVPNRLNYVLWIQDIIRAHTLVLESHSRIVRGIDIGTGASAIYPFLACKLEPDWRMVGTELDEDSYASAQQNVTTNDLESRIEIRKADIDSPILFPLEHDVHFDFTMCNPPFYTSAKEVMELAEEKELPPNAVCTGADIEMIYSGGGEAGFVGRMVEESMRFKTKCKWYTSMLGKMSSILSIVKLLHDNSVTVALTLASSLLLTTSKITNYAITEFVQGQTRRWAIAWSFTDTHLPDPIARIASISSTHALYPVLPPRNTLVQPFACAESVLREVLDETIRSLDLDGMQVTAKEALFFVEAEANTWSRSARRGRKRPAQSEGASESTAISTYPALTCSLRTISESPQGSGSIEYQWIFGKDRALFESFTSHVSRKAGARIKARSS
ncbi:hypothetical protein BDN70DRAFT_933402 [Pholiota conissans]|uniref:U6 small nuclear RNA (adenine-(43)-N(6))-methyltransferase n=1 Tax=Pholiota conissans TaxID=109636 RepID=A0A9P5Z0H6_9AGAR|nr:hypothetical protein BDN70DRAFT_933402 [Pholiota conissans]